GLRAGNGGSNRMELKMKRIVFKWLWHPERQLLTDKGVCPSKLYMRRVGMDADGSVINPTDWPDDVVLAAVQAAVGRRDQRRKDGAAKAAKTRAHRREKKIEKLAHDFLNREGIKPQIVCALCGKKLQ